MKKNVLIIFAVISLIGISCKHSNTENKADWYKRKVQAMWTVDSIYYMDSIVYSLEHRRTDFDITNAITFNKDGTCELPVIIGSNKEADYGKWEILLHGDSAFIQITSSISRFQGSYLAKIYAKNGAADKMRLISKKMTVTCLKMLQY